MKRNMYSVLFSTLCMLLMLMSCKKHDFHPEQANTFYGPQVEMGDGKARSFIVITKKGLPHEMGIELTDGALKGLPEDPEDFAAAFFALPLHQKAQELTTFDHIGINWNIHGHEPPHVYDIPHFDFHFYQITLQEQMAIPPYDVAPADFDNLPAPEYVPSMYLATDGGVPQMGKHWVDLLSPELNGDPFTYTMIYGSYAGKNTFVEPMITLETIKSGMEYHIPYRQPQLFSPNHKYYPSQYNIYMNPVTGKHYITLSDFVWR
ncbi:MAG: hypothetical protein ABIO76_10295 [Ginsengibacter sp.]